MFPGVGVGSAYIRDFLGTLCASITLYSATEKMQDMNVSDRNGILLILILG